MASSSSDLSRLRQRILQTATLGDSDPLRHKHIGTLEILAQLEQENKQLRIQLRQFMQQLARRDKPDADALVMASLLRLCVVAISHVLERSARFWSTPFDLCHLPHRPLPSSCTRG